MNKIYISGNYIIIEKAGTSVPFEYPCGKSVYTENDHAFSLKQEGRGTFLIPKSEITGGDWEDNDSNVLSESDIVTLLRENTGFNLGAPSSPSTGYKFKVVEFSAAQVNLMGDTPIDVLPLPAADEYHTYVGIVEIDGSIGAATGKWILLDNNSATLLNLGIGGGLGVYVRFNSEMTFPLSSTYWGGDLPTAIDNIVGTDLGNRVRITTDDGANPSGATAGGRVKIWYKTHKFGA
jgi:hypothetical protein